jgi:phosphoesterase RecJ-like protein
VRVPEQIVAAIEGAGSVLITTHSPMDGDGLGSGLALLRFLRGRGTPCRFVTEAAVPRAYGFLADYGEIELLADGDPVPAVELVVGLDAGEVSRLGRAGREHAAGTKLINIDHHVSNQGYGDVDWVEPSAAATGEQILELLSALGAEIDEESALCLLVALVTDTGRFCYSNTTADTLQRASRLVRLGADPDRLQRELYASVPLEVLRLQGAAVDAIEFDAGGRLAVLTIPHGFGAERQARDEDIKDLVDLVVSVQGVIVGALVRGLADGTSKVSLRSKSDAADVAVFAASLGGGGHRRAAGFSSEQGPEATSRSIRDGLVRLVVGAGE